ncbi:MAG: beta-N-acetylhexosaminidase [Alphaproteobacteria bacterium]|nr:MAG: beta-N-acetylhexosaminidase [Alphaproteobacteria bacterium]
MSVRAVIFGFAGTKLTEDEKNFFQDVDPFGFILFLRNIESPDQLRGLTDDLRMLSGRDDTPILIDQEGGRVARMREPHWRKAPAAGAFGALYETDPARAEEAAYLNYRLMAEELWQAGINVDCVPMLDVRTPDANEAVIGDRAFSDDPQIVTALGKTAADAMLAGGVLPVMKHMPGHGRARVDSHFDVPVVEAPVADLEAIDFAPFRALNHLPMGMTGHLVYPALADGEISTLSETIICEVIRSSAPGRIGFDGLLMTDDFSMGALSGDFAVRTQKALAAGCDVILHCNGDPEEMAAIASEIPELAGKSLERGKKALDYLSAPDDFDPADARNRLKSLMAGPMT